MFEVKTKQMFSSNYYLIVYIFWATIYFICIVIQLEHTYFCDNCCKKFLKEFHKFVGAAASLGPLPWITLPLPPK